MAYTAKTNWQLNETVMPADMNRIEQGIKDLDTGKLSASSPINPANIQGVVPITKGGTGASSVAGVITALGISLTDAKTLVVAANGNDTTGNGTSGTPYRTINKALSMLPKNLAGKTCIISVGAGTYSEVVSIKDFFGGTIVLNGVSGAVVNITGLTVENCTVLISDIAPTIGVSGIFIGTNGLLFSANSNITVSGAATGVTLRYGAKLEVSNSLTVNNATNTAILAQYNSAASISTLRGSGNGVGINALNSIVFCRQNELVATVASGTTAGHIYT